MPVAFRSPQVDCGLTHVHAAQANEEEPTPEKEPWNVAELVGKPSSERFAAMSCADAQWNELSQTWNCSAYFEPWSGENVRLVSGDSSDKGCRSEYEGVMAVRAFVGRADPVFFTFCPRE